MMGKILFINYIKRLIKCSIGGIMDHLSNPSWENIFNEKELTSERSEEYKDEDSFNKSNQFAFIIEEEKNRRNMEYIKSALIFVLNTMPKSVHTELHLSRLGALKPPITMFKYNRQHDDYTFTTSANEYFNERFIENPFIHNDIVVTNFQLVNKYKQGVNYYNRLMSYLTEDQPFTDFDITNQQDRDKFLSVIGAYNANNALYYKNGSYSFDVKFESNINRRLSKYPYDNIKSIYSATKLDKTRLSYFIKHIIDECNDYNEDMEDIVKNLLIEISPGELLYDNTINRKAFVAINKHLSYNPYEINSLYLLEKLDDTKFDFLVENVANDFGFDVEQLRMVLLEYRQKLKEQGRVPLYYISGGLQVINNKAIKIINEILKSHPYKHERSIITSIQDRRYVARFNIPGIWDNFAQGLYVHIIKYHKFVVGDKKVIIDGISFDVEDMYSYKNLTKFSKSFKLYAGDFPSTNIVNKN